MIYDGSVDVRRHMATAVWTEIETILVQLIEPNNDFIWTVQVGQHKRIWEKSVYILEFYTNFVIYYYTMKRRHKIVLNLIMSSFHASSCAKPS